GQTPLFCGAGLLRSRGSLGNFTAHSQALLDFRAGLVVSGTAILRVVLVVVLVIVIEERGKRSITRMTTRARKSRRGPTGFRLDSIFLALLDPDLRIGDR